MVPTAGVVVGATAAAVTYVVVAESGNAFAKVAHYGSFVASKVAGTGITLLMGATSGMVAEYATIHGGQQWLAPLITGSSRRAAMLSAAAVGAAAAAVTTAVYYGASWAWERSSKALSNVMRQPPMAITATVNDVGDDYQEIVLPPAVAYDPQTFPNRFDVLPKEIEADM